MSFLKNKKIQIGVGIFCGIAMIAILFSIFAGGERAADMHPSKSEQMRLEGFTFFDIGIHSKLTDAVRDELREKLGPDAIETRNPLDLSINYKGFLQSHFKELEELNRKLNFPPGERVEHNIIKLEYRYAPKKKVPFEYVELIFSNYNRKPMVFRISADKSGAFIVDTIREKYGQPQIIQWEKGAAQSLYWEKNRSILIISIVQDRYGNPEYHTTIYFTPNIKELVLKEQLEARKREEEIRRKAKTAF